MVSMSMFVVSARAGARGRSLIAGFIAVVCHEREMLGRQVSCQNMYTVPLGVPNDGFLKLVSTYAGTRCDGDHYVDVDVAGSTGQPEPGYPHSPRHVLVMPLSSIHLAFLAIPFHDSSKKTLETLTMAEPLMGTVVFGSILSP